MTSITAVMMSLNLAVAYVCNKQDIYISHT